MERFNAPQRARWGSPRDIPARAWPTPASPRFSRRNSGFTLIEVLVSVVIITVGILGVTAMQTASISGQVLSRNLDSSFNVVHDALDRMQNNSENITEYIRGSYSQPFTVSVDARQPDPALANPGERPAAGTVASDDYDAIYNAMYGMHLRNAVLSVQLTNDFPATGIDTADAKLTWKYKGKDKKCEVTTLITKSARKK